MNTKDLNFIRDLGDPYHPVVPNIIAEVSCNSQPFQIRIFVWGETLTAAYFDFNSDMLTHHSGTTFVFNATGEIIDLLKDISLFTDLCPIEEGRPYIDLPFKNMILHIRVYPDHQLEIVRTTVLKTSVFSQE